MVQTSIIQCYDLVCFARLENLYDDVSNRIDGDVIWGQARVDNLHDYGRLSEFGAFRVYLECDCIITMRKEYGVRRVNGQNISCGIERPC